MGRLNIAIIFGGCSPEYTVSLQSAHAVITHMDTSKYNPVMIGISACGDWYYFHGDIEKIKTDSWCNPDNCYPATLSLSRSKHQLLVFADNQTKAIDLHAAFPVLHGRNGEDGTVQGLLELVGIPLIGCSTLSSALCMDKHRAHQLAAIAGVKVPKSLLLSKYEDAKEKFAEADSFGYPLFVKPLRAGSSFGISKVSRPTELGEAVSVAFCYDDMVVIEEMIDGFEVGCAVLGNKNELIIGELDEIELGSGFFDFKQKYTLADSAIHVPARISEALAAEVKATAKKIYLALGCSGFARVDMFISEQHGIVFNEVNTIPGFTSHSRFPNMLKAVGLSFEQVIEKAIGMAVSK